MKYLISFAIALSSVAINAETLSTSTATSDSNAVKIQQTTQSVAQKLITTLGLTTITPTEKPSVSLKTVVIKALGEGKQMNEIRLATNQAVKEVTGKALEASPTPNVRAVAPTRVSQPVTERRVVVQPNRITANPNETTYDSETGKMVATLLPGESIFRMAQRVYGQENGRQYLEIYAANRDKIKDINVVVEGLVLVMP